MVEVLMMPKTKIAAEVIALARHARGAVAVRRRARWGPLKSRRIGLPPTK